MKAPVLHLVPRPQPATRVPAVEECSPDADPEVIHVAEMLLKHARSGRLRGIAWLALTNEGYYSDLAGAAKRQPTYTRGAIRALDDQLAKLVHQG